jgi:hypothetical protein
LEEGGIEMNVKEEKYIGSIILIFIIVIGFGATVVIPTMENAITATCCCNGSVCTDTYYNGSVCVLTMCKNMPFIDKSQCYYPADEKCENLTAI